MLSVRVAQRAYHPDAEQTALDAGHKSAAALRRTSLDGDQQILVLTNFGALATSALHWIWRD